MATSILTTSTGNANAKKRTRLTLLLTIITVFLIVPLRHSLKNLIIDLHQSATYHRSLTEQDIADKLPLLRRLEKAKIMISDRIVRKLPTWAEVVDLYGSEPVIHGLESCQAFRDQNVHSDDVIIAPSGMHNTGTNLFRTLIRDNCQIGDSYSPWWKHGPVSWAHQTEYLRGKSDQYKVRPIRNGDHYTNVLPVVMVKDPFHWMGSMCRHPYNVDWDHNKYNCPNIVRSEEYKAKTYNKSPILRVTYNKTEITRYNNLVHLWNEWNEGHLYKANYPHLVIRYEDLLFHTEEVVQKACECAGGTYSPKFQHNIKSAKPNHIVNDEHKTLLSTAMMRYGSSELRLEGFKEADVKYARKQLDHNLMDVFHYRYP